MRAVRALVGVLLAASLASCVGADDKKAVVRPFTGPPTPPVETPSPPGPGELDCVPSLRPTAALPAAGSMPAGSSMEEIRRKGYLTAGIDQSTYPFGYLDVGDDRLKGFDIDLLREVAKAIFGSADDAHIRFVVLRNADRAQAVAEGRVDIVAQTATITCTRERDVTFTVPYLVAGQRILVSRNDTAWGLADRRGQRVCAVNGSTSLARISDPKYGLQTVIGDTWSDCLVKLQQGEADAVSTDDGILAGLQRQDPLFTKVVGDLESSEPYGMLISKNRPDLVRFVNSLLAKLSTDGTWTKLHNTYLSTGGPAASPPKPEYDQ